MYCRGSKTNCPLFGEMRVESLSGAGRGGRPGPFSCPWEPVEIMSLISLGRIVSSSGEEMSVFILGANPASMGQLLEIILIPILIIQKALIPQNNITVSPGLHHKEWRQTQ